MYEPFEVAPDTFILPSAVQVPGLGFIPLNAFVITGKEPILIDTGINTDGDRFIKALTSIVDPSDLKCIWLTHDDLDHIGNAQRIIEMAPDARLFVHPLIAIRLDTSWPIPLDRVRALSPGDVIGHGDRELIAVRPPLFDNPGTIGFLDKKTRAFLCADSFGALLPSIEKDASMYDERVLAQGMTMWATFDSSWVHLVDQERFGRMLDNVLELEPSVLLSSHLPAAKGIHERLLGTLRALPGATPFIAPNSDQFLQVAKAIMSMRKGSQA